jgi:hypothetical protein
MQHGAASRPLHCFYSQQSPAGAVSLLAREPPSGVVWSLASTRPCLAPAAALKRHLTRRAVQRIAF